MENTPLSWILVNPFVTGLLLPGLLVPGRCAHAVKLREALGWGTGWVPLAPGFNHRKVPAAAILGEQVNLERPVMVLLGLVGLLPGRSPGVGAEKAGT
jgi:hypothetical protein